MLHDTRLDALADLLIHHSLALKKGEIFQINAAISARPLVVALYRVAAQSGVFPVIRWQDRGINRMAYDFILPDVPESGWFLAVMVWTGDTGSRPACTPPRNSPRPSARRWAA